MVKGWKFNEIKSFYNDVRKNGLKANAQIKKAFYTLQKILEFSEKGLRKENIKKKIKMKPVF